MLCIRLYFCDIGMETRTGYVDKITYRNEENGYTVMTFISDGKQLTAVGVIPLVSEGETLCLYGEETVHPVYGEQFKIDHCTFDSFSDAHSVERYLASGAIKGVGKAMAHRIVSAFGEDTLNVLEKEPERLSEIRGISERKAMEISDQIVEKRETRNALLYLQKYDISISLAIKIYQAFGEETYKVLEENPYRIADSIEGVGFQTADRIAANMNIAPDSEYRIRSGIEYVLSRFLSEGDMYVTEADLLTQTEALLSLSIADFHHILEEMTLDRRIYMRKSDDGTHVYLRNAYLAENNTAVKLTSLNTWDSEMTDEEAEKKVTKIEKKTDLHLDTDQRNALKTAMRNGVTILTGGPGTGKTTTIKALIRLFTEDGMDVTLAAPTGRAAKRMTEATGMEAKTIHRLLEIRMGESQHFHIFGKNEENPLETDVVIIDEMSMVDIFLMQALLRAIVPGVRLILVGDKDQLPSVGPGEVLRDIIRSDCFPVVELHTIYRQSEESDIILNAHKINEGEEVENRPSKDFLFIERPDAGRIIEATKTLLLKKLPDYLHIDARDVQILTPMKKGPIGANELNGSLQNVMNPKSDRKKEKAFGDIIFRVGDKVMQTKNNYELEWTICADDHNEYGAGIYNGEIGIIEDISEFEEIVTVLFDSEKRVLYPFASLSDLELSYAITIHKSQGSEYPAVILPLLTGPTLLMTRRLLYTAVTRAEKCVCIVGSYATFCQMVQSPDSMKRASGLSEAIQSQYERS